MEHDRVYPSAVAPVRVFHILLLAPYLPCFDRRLVLKDRTIYNVVDPDANLPVSGLRIFIISRNTICITIHMPHSS